jgi:hypothetical protein
MIACAYPRAAQRNDPHPRQWTTRASQRARAVWFAGAMGLLDDAIREHLELKRLRGGDPGDVARAEQDALGPMRGDAGAALVDHAAHLDAQPSAAGSFFSESGSTHEESPSTLGVASQETVEINMEAELERGVEDERQGGTLSGVHAAPLGRSAYTQTDPDESLEWESPGEHPSEQTRLVASDGDMDAQHGGTLHAAEPVEDVLEETPDFLRDTPEQERLWFEQRPPRDFDFDG